MSPVKIGEITKVDSQLQSSPYYIGGSTPANILITYRRTSRNTRHYTFPWDEGVIGFIKNPCRNGLSRGFIIVCVYVCMYVYLYMCIYICMCMPVIIITMICLRRGMFF